MPFLEVSVRRVHASALVLVLTSSVLLQETAWGQQTDSAVPPAAQSPAQSTNPTYQGQPAPPSASDQSTDQQNKSPNLPAEQVPDSPGAVSNRSGSNGSETQPVMPSPQPQAQPVNPAQKSQPVGTAAAEGISPSGTAASEPAGVAVAPAKQHQKRNILIAVGAVAGAAVAVGTIVGLSKASPSTPPGAH
jgi:hypothetical protein